MARDEPSLAGHPQGQNRPQHRPEDYPHDLNPDYLAGQHDGTSGPHPEKTARAAADIKDLHEQFPHLNSADLRNIPIMPEGSRLEQGATYLDLRHIERGEFVARGDMVAGPDTYYVPKSGGRLSALERVDRRNKPRTPGSTYANRQALTPIRFR